MKDKKLQIISNLFEGKEIRSLWVPEMEDYQFNVVDVINALTEPKDASDYWTTLKKRLTKEEYSEIPTNCRKLKFKSYKDGKYYPMDTLDTEGIFRLIESIPSKKAEPFKLWLAKLGRQKVDEVYDPSKGIDEMIDFYLKKGYTLGWIEARIKSIIDRKKLTNLWHDNGVQEGKEYAILTNAIYKEWSGMTASEYKLYKGIRKENLRDNMSDIEVILTDLGETVTRDIARNEKPVGLSENRKVAKRGGSVAKKTKEFYEETTGLKAITNSNSLNYKYSDNILEKKFKEYDGPNLAKEFEWDEPRGKEII